MNRRELEDLYLAKLFILKILSFTEEEADRRALAMFAELLIEKIGYFAATYVFEDHFGIGGEKENPGKWMAGV